MGLVSVETLQLGCILIFAFFCHMTPNVGLLLGLRNTGVGVTGRFWPRPALTPTPVQPTGTFSTSALVALMSWSRRSAV